MGWLDNSTNNIILDAVLTDFGREALARNNGSFAVAKFSLGDDEVNYGIITKYGRTIGREKIEKNTPVFEALTNQNLALKYKLISIPAPLVYLPIFSLDANVATLNIGKSVNVTVKQSLAANDSAVMMDSNISDANFDLYYPSLFLTIGAANNMPGQVSLDALRTAHTTIQSTVIDSTGSRNSTFTLYAKTLSTTTLSTYGRQVVTNGPYQISTAVKVVGQSSGLSLIIPVTISQS